MMKRGMVVGLILLLLMGTAGAEVLPAEDADLLRADARYLLGITDLPDESTWQGVYVTGGEQYHERLYRIEYQRTSGEQARISYLINDRFRDIAVEWPDEIIGDETLPDMTYDEMNNRFAACCEKNPDFMALLLQDSLRNNIIYQVGLIDKPGWDSIPETSRNWICVFGGDGSTIYDNTVVDIQWSVTKNRIERASIRFIQ